MWALSLTIYQKHVCEKNVSGEGFTIKHTKQNVIQILNFNVCNLSQVLKIIILYNVI